MRHRARVRVAMIVFLAAAAASVLPPAAVADEWVDEGHGAYLVQNTMTKLDSGDTVVEQTSRGFVFSTVAGSPLQASTQDCAGTGRAGAAHPEGLVFGHCHGVDRDGDSWWIWWSSTGDRGEWGFLGGTGKWAGVKGGGTTATVMESESRGRLMIRWKGRYTLP